MKTLMFLCLTLVSAAAAVYLWGQYQSYAASSARAEDRTRAKNELFDLAQAGPEEANKVRTFCRFIDSKPYDEVKNDDYLRRINSNCLILGYR